MSISNDSDLFEDDYLFTDFILLDRLSLSLTLISKESSQMSKTYSMLSGTERLSILTVLNQVFYRKYVI
jgi:hypothetical protein